MSFYAPAERRAVGDSGTVDSIRAGQPHRAHKRGRRSHRTWTRPIKRKRERKASDLPTWTAAARVYLVLIFPSPPPPFYFFLQRPHPSSQRRSMARDIPSLVFRAPATTIIKLTVLKSDSRDVRIPGTPGTRSTDTCGGWQMRDHRTGESRSERFNLPRPEAGYFRFGRSIKATWDEKKSVSPFISFSLTALNYDL